MTVEKRFVLVGIRIDNQSRQLLNWALVKLTQPGDSVVALHVVKTKSSDDVSKNKSLIDGYSEIYEGLCDVKKVGLSGQIITGRSIRNILVREAKNHGALALVVGESATAKYCAKRLPPTTNVLAIQDSRIVFGRCNNKLPPGNIILDPRPNLRSIDNLSDRTVQSEFGSSLEESEKSPREKTKDFKETANESEGCKTWSISLFAGDPFKEKLGWPLLHRAHSEISQRHHHGREMSVVQWAMSLPDRSPQSSPQSSSIDENPFERSISDILEDANFKNYLPPSVVLPKGLDGILNVNSLNCKWFSLEALKSCTNKFSSENLIGKGGNNRVYKGVLSDGKPIAVKVLQSSKEAWKDFAFEMEIISTLKHKNITQLLGICIEDNTVISVYDYFPQGSLEENLHGTNKDGSILSWEVRFDVAVGIAEALNYLHTEALKPVIHRDVKSSNILLSMRFEPQLSDFGAAIWGPITTSFLTEQDVVGTFGYLAPEYFMYGKVSDKIDVYAFGVVLLELISGKEPISSEPCKGQESLVTWAKPIIEGGNIKDLLDSKLEGKVDEVQMKRMVLAASLCITRAARLRPNLNQILKILKGDDEVENWLNEHCAENEENIDDEVYPNSSTELHLSLALLGVEDDSGTSSSTCSSSSIDHSYNQNLKDQWNRSWSFN